MIRPFYLPSIHSLDDNLFSSTSRIEEREEGYFLQVDMPGVKKETLTIELDDNNLVVEGTRIGRESIKKVYSLPEDVDVNNIKAQISDGVLELALPKKEKAKPSKIMIEEAKVSFFPQST